MILRHNPGFYDHVNRSNNTTVAEDQSVCNYTVFIYLFIL